MKKGVLYGIGAYLLWGLFPIYWKWLGSVPAIQLISHRIIWSFVLLAMIVFVTQQWKAFRSAVLSPKVILIYLASAIFLSINWLTYVWAINSGYVVESSLGYFINPLLSVLLGVLFLREKLRPWQWVPIGLAAVGVTYVAISYGQFPWIALTLACSFAVYGLIKKTAPLGSLYGLTLETGLLFIPAVAFLLIMEGAGAGRIPAQRIRERPVDGRRRRGDHHPAADVRLGRAAHPAFHGGRPAIYHPDHAIHPGCIGIS